MPIPNLIHPVAVVIEPIQRSQTIVDDDYGEEFESTDYGVPVTIKGQIKWGKDDKLRPTDLGAESGSDGYVLFRKVDLATLSLSDPKQGDRISKLGTVNVDVYVVEVRHEGHYSDQSGPTLVKAYFKDRNPAKQDKGVTYG